MPRSPKSVVDTHGLPSIRPFSNGEVALVVIAMRNMKRLRSVRNVNRVRSLIARLFSFHQQDWRINEIFNALNTANVFSRAFNYQIHETLDRYRIDYSPVESDYSDDDL